MKKDLIDFLKEKGKQSMFTEVRYATMKELMKLAVKKDEWLKNYLSLDPLNKSQWMADQMVTLVEAGHI